MLHVVLYAQYVEEVLQHVVGVNPVCVEEVFARADWDKPRLFWYVRGSQPRIKQKKKWVS